MQPTSVLAHDQMESSGNATIQRAKVLAVCERYDGLTAGEIGEKCGMTNAQAGRRLSDLERDGVVRADQKRARKCSVNHRLMQTW